VAMAAARTPLQTGGSPTVARVGVLRLGQVTRVTTRDLRQRLELGVWRS
jgi:hypothetical protein